ncbi:MAG: hypothetical protein OXP69_25175 [Spirochaetaceae bacterium]|nr:hypothetical protein [Spirochaetaceae bacterium]
MKKNSLVRYLSTIGWVNVVFFGLLVVSVAGFAFTLGVIGDQQRIIGILEQEVTLIRYEIVGEDLLPLLLFMHKMEQLDDAEATRLIARRLGGVPDGVNALIEVTDGNDELRIMCTGHGQCTILNPPSQ